MCRREAGLRSSLWLALRRCAQPLRAGGRAGVGGRSRASGSGARRPRRSHVAWQYGLEAGPRTSCCSRRPRRPRRGRGAAHGVLSLRRLPLYRTFRKPFSFFDPSAPHPSPDTAPSGGRHTRAGEAREGGGAECDLQGVVRWRGRGRGAERGGSGRVPRGSGRGPQGLLGSGWGGVGWRWPMVGWGGRRSGSHMGGESDAVVVF